MAISRLDQLKNNQQRALDRGLTDRASTIGQTIDKLSMPTISTGTNKVIDANPTFKQKTVTLPQDRMSPISPTPTNPVTTFGAPKTQITENDLIWKAYNNQRLSREELDFAVEQEKKRQEAQKATLQSTGYQDAINLANKQAADAEANRASQEQLIRDRENAARTTGYQRIDEAAQLQQDLARQQGQERQNQQQQAYSFSGFGRSTANARALDKIAVDTSRQVQTLEAARQAQKTLLDAELRGASDEEIRALSQNVSALQAKAKEIEIAALANIAELNQQNQVTGAEALQNILKVYGQVNPEGAADIDAAASKGVGYLIRKDGTAVVGANGEPIKFAEAESMSYTGDVGQWRQAIKSGAIPPGTSFDDFNRMYGSDKETDIIGGSAGGKFTEAQKALLSTIDPSKIDGTTLRLLDAAGLSVGDLGTFLSTDKKQLSPDKRADIEDILASIDKLSKMDGMSSAVGFGLQKWLAGSNEEDGFISGSKAENFRKEFLAFRDRLVLPSLDKLKGAMSDKDIQFLRNAATSLSLSQSEEQFKKSLQELKSKYQSILSGAPQMSLLEEVDAFYNSLPTEKQVVLEGLRSDPSFKDVSDNDFALYIKENYMNSPPSFNSVGSDTEEAAKKQKKSFFSSIIPGASASEIKPLPPKNGVEAWKTLFGTQSTPTTILNGMKVITKSVAPNLQKLADNCVLFARSIVPNIPTGAISVAGRKEGIKKAEEGGYGGFGGVGAKVGDAIHTSEGNVGHSAVIVDETPTQWILKEANYKSGQITKGRAINKDDPKIIGWISPTKTKVKSLFGEGKNEGIEKQVKSLFNNYS